MKKVFYILMLLLPCTLQGKGVTPDSAKEIATHFMDRFPRTRSGAAGEIQLLWDGKTVSQGLITDPPFYVYGWRDGGFVIIAGEDCVKPVLGYSDRNVFRTEQMPDHLSGWFEGLAEVIREAREKGVEPSEAVRKEWVRVRSEAAGNQTPVIEHQTAQWNQGYPYNVDIPKINGSLCLTGCGTTATAIVMRFHKWPPQGQGVLDDYSYISSEGTINISGYPLGHPYNWDNMPLTNIGSTNEDIAQLMKDVGIMNYCMFGIEASGTSPHLIPRALATHMDYDKRCCLFQRSYYSSEEWESLIRKELDEGRPVLYSGTRQDGGHLWVIDGYSAEGYFDMNWGWGGYANGYYLISPTWMTGQDFTEAHAAIFPIKPASPDDPFRIEDFLVVTKLQFVWNYQGGSRARFNYTITNSHWSDTIIQSFRLALTDADGNLKQWLGDPVQQMIRGGSAFGTEVSAFITVPVNTGDRVRVYMEEDGEWIPLRGGYEVSETPFGPRAPIEECTELSFVIRQSEKHLTVKSDPANYIEISVLGQTYSFMESADWIFDTRAENVHVLIRNLTESKEFDIILKK